MLILTFNFSFCYRISKEKRNWRCVYTGQIPKPLYNWLLSIICFYIKSFERTLFSFTFFFGAKQKKNPKMVKYFAFYNDFTYFEICDDGANLYSRITYIQSSRFTMKNHYSCGLFIVYTHWLGLYWGKNFFVFILINMQLLSSRLYNYRYIIYYLYSSYTIFFFFNLFLSEITSWNCSHIFGANSFFDKSKVPPKTTSHDKIANKKIQRTLYTYIYVYLHKNHTQYYNIRLQRCNEFLSKTFFFQMQITFGW